MELTKEKAKENLSKLIEKFERELKSGQAEDYNEEATKISFIQPLLKNVLGWDVNDHNEVSPEEKVSHGRVDYSLRVERKIKIFIEAKPIKADLKKHIEQAVRYGYNRKDVPFILLTDFEGIKLFDVTVKPDLRNPLKGLKIDLTWDQYIKQFDKLWMLSKESVLQGELDKLLLVKPKERLPVDKAILDDLRRWREVLAKDIFKNNIKLFHSGNATRDADYLKEITQRILDRIIFIRSCEDRGLVHRRLLKELFEERTESVGTETMVFLKEEFRQYGMIFDSDLFSPKEWEDNLAIDFEIMQNIVLETYNPYQFDVIPLEVLGNIYEQYLGYTIRLTEHQVKYELKPDVRKVGGVYYTPEYIVDYIVKNTVGKLLEELSPNKIKKLRILDPACGSGSFLIRAYEEMLKYYQTQKKREKKIVEEQGKLDLQHEGIGRHLTIHEKAEILRNHIYGVDIDEQAVEVTKLSLMLKLLEGEHGIIPGRAILPMLDRNIRCGNSLISGDALELKKYFGDDWHKVKPFNWDKEFKEIMVNEGGFDVVIGNPPYGAELYNEEYMRINYPYSSSMREINSYLYFSERAYSILKKKGNFGFIMPDTFLLKIQYYNFRKFLIEKVNIYEIIETGVVFEQSKATPNVILFFNKSQPTINSIFQRKQLDYTKCINDILNDLNLGNWFKKGELSYREWKKSFYLQLGRYIDNKKGNIIKHILNNKRLVPLREIKDIEVDRGLEGGKSSLLNKYKKGVSQILIPDNIYKYFIYNQPKYFTLVYRSSFNFDRILIIRIRNIKIKERIVAAYENKKRATLKTIQQVYFACSSKMDLKYILGILNSNILNFYCNHFLVDDINREYLLQLPICTINYFVPSEKQIHDNLVALVDVMLDLNKKTQTAKGSEKEQLQRQIEETDKEIDNLVYKLYGITEEERKIIESTENK